MHRLRRLAAMMLACIILVHTTGCALMFASRKPVRLELDPAGTEVLYNQEDRVVRDGDMIEVKPKLFDRPVLVEVIYDERTGEERIIKHKLQSDFEPLTLLNILGLWLFVVPGVVGFVVDGSSGAMSKPKPINQVSLTGSTRNQ